VKNLGGVCSNGVNRLYGVGLWKFIRRGWKQFSKFTGFEVEDGFKISFWYGILFGVLPLKGVFWKLFCIAFLGMLMWQIIFSSVIASPQ
jgi:hypothetical protein